MKINMPWLFLLTLFGCTSDVFIPCSGDGPTGSLCREYRLYNDAAQGYVEFEYTGDSVVSTIYNQNSILEKTVIERYDNDRIISVTNQFPSSESVVGTYHYNEIDSLFLIVYGANDSSLHISYVDGKRFRELRVIDSDTVSSKEYRYFQNGSELYRISDYDSEGELIRYRNFDYFNTDGVQRYRASLYTSTHELVGRRLFTFSQLGLISSMEFRLSDGTVVESKNYIYDGAGKLTEKFSQVYGNTSKSVYLYY